MPDQEARLTALEAAHKELEDAFVVMTHLETKMGQMLREQAEYLAMHEARLKQSEQQMEQQRQFNREVDERIAKLVSAIGALIAGKQ
jgi:hypothetical protein